MEQNCRGFCVHCLLDECFVVLTQLEESKKLYVQSKTHTSLNTVLEGKEKELTTAAQKLQETLSAAGAADKTIKQLNEAVQHFDYKC